MDEVFVPKNAGIAVAEPDKAPDMAVRGLLHAAWERVDSAIRGTAGFSPRGDSL
jgi:hypothetical protein